MAQKGIASAAGRLGLLRAHADRRILRLLPPVLILPHETEGDMVIYVPSECLPGCLMQTRSEVLRAEQLGAITERGCPYSEGCLSGHGY